jgi:hypothetical protein
MGIPRQVLVAVLVVTGLASVATARVDTLRQGSKGYAGCTDTYVHWYNQNGYGCNDNSTQNLMKAQSG